MPKPHPIQITIADPCHQSWADMTAAGRGRFCNACQKTVVDFTTYSDAALYRFFATNPQNVCGRFLNTQLNVPINIPHQPHSLLYRMTIAFGLTLLFTQTPALLAQTRPPVASQDSYNSIHADTLPSEVIEGKITDGKNSPVSNAIISLYQNNKLIKKCLSQYDGTYYFHRLRSGKYDMLVDFAGMDTVISRNVAVKENDIAKENFILKNEIVKDKYRSIITGEVSASTIVPIHLPIVNVLLFGKLTDNDQNPLPGVKIVLYQRGEEQYTALTDIHGAYVLSGMRQGHYTIQISSAGNRNFHKNIEVLDVENEQNITVTDMK